MLPPDAVQCVTVRGVPTDSAAVRLSLSRQLASIDLRVQGAPPSAILLIRALEDPMPGRFSANPAAAHADSAWERALRSRIDAARRSAARPREGRVDAAAEAVLFADEAELVACWAAARTGDGIAVAWWQKALARYVSARSLAELLAHRMERLPAVFTYLTRWSAAERVVADLSEETARGLILAMARSVGIALHLDPGGPKRAVGGNREGRSDQTRAATANRLEGDAATDAVGESLPTAARPRTMEYPARPVRAPWHRLWTPSSPSALAPTRELLVGLAVMLQRTPAETRSVDFPTRVSRWLQTTRPAETPSNAPNTTQSNATGHVSDASQNSASDRERGRTTATTLEDTDLALHKAPPPPTIHFLDRDDRPANAARTDLVRDGPEMVGIEPACDVEDGEGEARRERWSQDGVATRLGGVLYLINLVEHLDLPRCCETDCRLASAVGSFGTLEAIARALAGPLAPEDRDDPIWELLAALDQRGQDEPPRAGGLRVEELRLPPAWLASIEADQRTLRWAVSADRLCVWAEAGFPLLERALQPGAPELQARATVTRSQHLRAWGPLERGNWSERPIDDLEHLRAAGWSALVVRWLSFVTPFLRWRLALALGSPSPCALNPLERIFRCPATIYVSETHVDLVASLAAISFPVRLAGLDRSPSWVSQLRRAVLFHFE